MNLLIASLFLFSSSSIATNAEKWEGKYFKQGQSARCADFVGQVVSQSKGTPPKNYQKCTSWLNWGKKVSVDKIQRGDIVIYASNGSYHHIGIYVGNGQIIHRPTMSKPVTRLNYKYRKIIAVRRM
jgi:cell wall-associated NlpC family hydrolase